MACRSLPTRFLQSANQYNDQENYVSASKEADMPFNSTFRRQDGFDLMLKRPDDFLQECRYLDTSSESGESSTAVIIDSQLFKRHELPANHIGGYLCRNNLEDEEELSLFDRESSNVSRNTVDVALTDTGRQVKHWRRSFSQEKLAAPVSRRNRISSDSALYELPKISKVPILSSSSLTYKDMIRQSFLDSSDGTLDESTVATMCRVFALPRKTILRSFKNHRNYVETRIKSMLIDMNVDNLCSPLINSIASKLRATTTKVKNCFNKYSKRIQDAIKAKKSKPPLSAEPI